MSVIRYFLATFCGGVLLPMMFSPHLSAQSITRIPPPEFIPMATDTASLVSDPVLAETSFTMQPMERRRVFGRAEIASSSDSISLAVAFVQCVGPDGFASQHGDTNQNHQGKNTPIGPSYPHRGELALYPSLLLVADKPGTYTCSLVASGDKALTAIARDYDGSSMTWLQVSAEADSGAGWWQNLFCDMYGHTVPTDENGNSSCLYLDGATNQKQIYIFDNDGSPARIWQADSKAAFVDASDSLLLTTCYYGTHSCTSDNTEGWLDYVFDNPGGTMVQSHLELIQLNPDGGVCNATWSPDQTTRIGNDPHHYMLYHSLVDVPIYPCNGSRSFKLRIFLKYLSGNPVKIDGSGSGPGASTFTHAYAINSSYGTAVPVPYLIGLTENQARGSIKAAGYAVSPVSYSVSTEPAGSVIFQYPVNGVINYPGTAVEFTVSTGGAAVPNLLSLPESSAISEINALGLVPSVSPSKACIEPGAVLTQNPRSGVVVSLGSTVYITVDSGTRQTCIFK